MEKYYILRRNNATILNDFICELPIKLREACIKRTDFRHGLILIEKSCHDDNTESYSNVWTMHTGLVSLWQIYTKGRETYDYTGIVQPLIHLNGVVRFFDDHINRETKF